MKGPGWVKKLIAMLDKADIDCAFRGGLALAEFRAGKRVQKTYFTSHGPPNPVRACCKEA